ncbi:MAG: RNA-binding protein [Defluviitaleaceae bacterium]|nr:RNA-binding protein [Defluviitaleaceae bacterium]
MELSVGQIVFSKAGRDRGAAMIIIGLTTERDGEYAICADGDKRPLAAPKKKKAKHLQPTRHIAQNIAHAITAGQHIMDSDLRKEISLFKKEVIAFYG